jgi:heme/copper-type cytochrome/quinol oxidase subunit 2
VTRLQMRGGAVVGGARDIEVEAGDTVRIVVASDAADEIHLHGYDITRNAAPGQPARFRFKAEAEGAFEIESHVAEDAGRDPLIARLVVEPS